ncbi:hypothetical protein WMY93_023422 [Mugilogobius chulae]|uniref:ZP domain-containing protein n=1 Tax=Mugilogobius chulae TaxID=88201 RepID=A0AAW0NGL8_9GOBI
MFGIGQFINPGGLTLGDCAVSAEDNKAKYSSFNMNCRAVAMTDQSFIYSYVLHYNPQMFGDPPVVRTSQAAVIVECHYQGISTRNRLTTQVHAFLHTDLFTFRRQNVSSLAIDPVWVPFSAVKAAEEFLYFSLKLMTDDWMYERPSGQYFLGDVIHIEASVMQFFHVPLRVYVDSCVATLVPDVNSSPRYAFIDNRGDTFSLSVLASQWRNKLRFQLEAFRFQGVESGQMYITCQLKATSTSLNVQDQHRACSYVNNAWREQAVVQAAVRHPTAVGQEVVQAAVGGSLVAVQEVVQAAVGGSLAAVQEVVQAVVQAAVGQQVVQVAVGVPSAVGMGQAVRLQVVVQVVVGDPTAVGQAVGQAVQQAAVGVPTEVEQAVEQEVVQVAVEDLMVGPHQPMVVVQVVGHGQRRRLGLAARLMEVDQPVGQVEDLMVVEQAVGPGHLMAVGEAVGLVQAQGLAHPMAVVQVDLGGVAVAGQMQHSGPSIRLVGLGQALGLEQEQELDQVQDQGQVGQALGQAGQMQGPGQDISLDQAGHLGQAVDLEHQVQALGQAVGLGHHREEDQTQGIGRDIKLVNGIWNISAGSSGGLGISGWIRQGSFPPVIRNPHPAAARKVRDVSTQEVFEWEGEVTLGPFTIQEKEIKA